MPGHRGRRARERLGWTHASCERCRPGPAPPSAAGRPSRAAPAARDAERPSAQYARLMSSQPLTELRHLLHAHAEVGLHLPRTQEIVLDALGGLGLEISAGEGLSSVTAVLRGGRPGPVVLLRADMDALPLAEETGLSFAATGNAMHACGHDMHMAGLVGAARLLAERR